MGKPSPRLKTTDLIKLSNLFIAPYRALSIEPTSIWIILQNQVLYYPLVYPIQTNSACDKHN